MKEDETETNTQAGGTKTYQKKLVKGAEKRLRGVRKDRVVKDKSNESGKNWVSSKHRKRKDILK